MGEGTLCGKRCYPYDDLKLSLRTGTFDDSLPTLPKGQLNSERIYEVIASPKMPTKNLKDFCPGRLLEVRGRSQTTFTNFANF